ncbi:MAG TPA: hypothetical protein VF370_02895 [Candidatus Cryosericum sp.]
MVRGSRKGMALITVVLIAALVFASIVGIVATVVPEKKMIVSRSVSQRALTAAETGLSQVVFNLRNADFSKRKTDPVGATAPDGNTAYLTIDKVQTIAQAPPSASTCVWNGGLGTPPDGGGTPYVVYNVKIQKTGGASISFDFSDMPTSSGTVFITIYSLGIVYDKQGQGGTVLARKAISTRCEVGFALGGGTSLNYSMVSGASINFNSNAPRVLQGDVWAGGDITKGPNTDKSNIMLDGIAYAGGHVDSGVVDPSKVVENAAPPNTTLTSLFTTLKANYSQAMAAAFQKGDPPYDGTVPGYPNTNLSGLPVTTDQGFLRTMFTYYLGDSTNFARIASFYPDLSSGEILKDYSGKLTTNGITFLTNLQGFATNSATANEIVCYYDAGMQNNNSNNTVNDAMLGGIPLGGTLVIKGDLSITKSPTVVNAAPTNPLVLSVTGDVSLTGGLINANIYASGENAGTGNNGQGNPSIGVGRCILKGYLATPLGIGVAGGFTCNGSLVSGGQIDVNGTVNIKYDPTGGMPMPGSSAVTVNAAQGTWQQISYDAFNAAG